MKASFKSLKNDLCFCNFLDCITGTEDITEMKKENEKLKQQSNSVYDIVKEYVMSHHCISTMRMLKKIEKVMCEWIDLNVANVLTTMEVVAEKMEQTDTKMKL